MKLKGHRGVHCVWWLAAFFIGTGSSEQARDAKHQQLVDPKRDGSQKDVHDYPRDDMMRMGVKLIPTLAMLGDERFTAFQVVTLCGLVSPETQPHPKDNYYNQSA
jgi:hypothetical protein